MQAFHNNPKIKADLVLQIQAHYAADEIIKGTYWQYGKGCAVGCCVHGKNHNLFPVRFGIPESIAHLMDGIFEGLPNEKAKEFHLKLISEIQVGADLSKIENLFLEWLLIDPVHGIIQFNSDPCIPTIAALHRSVADGTAVSPVKWSAARAAARAAAEDAAAGGAARDAARSALSATRAASAAGAAARSASSAAWAAWAAAGAASAAGAAAGAAAWAAQSQKLIELLAAAAV